VKLGNSNGVGTQRDREKPEEQRKPIFLCSSACSLFLCTPTLFLLRITPKPE
jgi:hypothetical protein